VVTSRWLLDRPVKPGDDRQVKNEMTPRCGALVIARRKSRRHHDTGAWIRYAQGKISLFRRTIGEAMTRLFRIVIATEAVVPIAKKMGLDPA
jgi:hypothetical protein